MEVYKLTTAKGKPVIVSSEDAGAVSVTSIDEYVTS